MSDAAARALAADGLPATREDAEAWYFDNLMAQVEGRRDAAARKARDAADLRATNLATLDEVHQLQHQTRTGSLATKAFVHWLASGERSLDLGPEIGQKAALVEDAAGRVLVPVDVVTQVLREVELRSAFRDPTVGASVRPTVRLTQRQGMLGAATAEWQKLETGGVAPDANVVPENPPLEIETHDAVSLCKIGDDELADEPAAVEQSVVEAIADAVLVLEDTAFALGSGTGQPRGLAAAANVSRVAAGQKTSAAVTATPVIADLATVVGKLPYRYRARATWLFSEDAFAAILKLQWTNGDSLMPRAGEGIGPFGWPYRVAPLPSMATAGVTDPSVWFTDLGASYRIVDRMSVTAQRLRQAYITAGLVGFLVRRRVGADMVRPEACSVYLL